MAHGRFTLLAAFLALLAGSPLSAMPAASAASTEPAGGSGAKKADRKDVAVPSGMIVQ
ncbi:MAG: hypothetical protein QGG24_09555 [Vicinamibacterales bacterium]|jgi:hypothetical protein|nr:hypothetical protein [Vicinamibacterales bacterium]MDP7473267.1 hypothetical protein [Vicinamibacterales bacterium]MDP7671323.1 hypothetical protein [Vicinamibacterales bacterium]HJO38549.1 hypothetical protein [Vicinamibacterales bacterium]|tara:strand:+ start:3336 stop:3509 length:174 start_codon:yes stop_codon:yes gene_type:complete